MNTPFTIRETETEDLEPLLRLYTHLHHNEMPAILPDLLSLWKNIQNDPNHHIIVGFIGDKLVCSCVLIIVPNLTHHQRPYAFIENVITHPQHRKKGYATSILSFARNIAVNEGCYKMMLMTSSEQEETFRFYEKSGFNRQDKTALIQWLSSEFIL